MNDFYFSSINQSINLIKLKIDNLNFLNGKKDFIVLISTHDYLKYVSNFLDSYYKNNLSYKKIFIFTIKNKGFKEKNISLLKRKYKFYNFEIIIDDNSSLYINEISANIRFHIINILMPYSKSILYLDADSIVLKDLKKMYDYFSRYSIALRKHPEHRNGSLNHYYPIKSGFIYIKNNNLGRDFLNSAISDIQNNLHIWYADQKAISHAYFKIGFNEISNVLLFQSNFFDWKLYPEPYIYSAKGIRKNTFFFAYFSKMNRFNRFFLFKKVCFFLITIENLIRNIFKLFRKIFK